MECFLNVTDYLPCYLILKRMLGVLVEVLVKGLGVLREFSQTGVKVKLLMISVLEKTAFFIFYFFYIC